MKETTRTLLILTVIFGLVQFPISQTRASIPDKERHLDFRIVNQVLPISRSILDQKMMNAYFPTNLTPTSDQTALVMQLQTGMETRITDQFFNGEFFKKTSVGKVATNIQEVAQPEFTFKPNDGPPQKIDFNFRPFEQTATMNYEGYLNSSVVYNLAQNNVVIGISKKLDADTTLAFSNTSGAGKIDPNGNLTITYTF